jgi:hypothetical protein
MVIKFIFNYLLRCGIHIQYFTLMEPSVPLGWIIHALFISFCVTWHMDDS